jgi:maltooligosyltrehalose synthase
MKSIEQVLTETASKITELSVVADKQEGLEVSRFHGWMKDFKPSAYLSSLTKEIKRLDKVLANLAKKEGQERWNQLVKMTNVCPELYEYGPLVLGE